LRLRDSRYSTLCDQERSEPDHDIALKPVVAGLGHVLGCGRWRIAMGGDLMKGSVTNNEFIVALAWPRGPREVTTGPPKKLTAN
jgi:hypothetical protein